MKENPMAEIVRKPQPTPTTVLSVRVDASLKDEYAKARKAADRQSIDLSAMMSVALGDVFKAVIGASSTKVSSLNDRRGSE
jgi:hypothetical protein